MTHAHLKKTLLATSAGRTLAMMAGLALLSACAQTGTLSSYQSESDAKMMKTEMTSASMVLPATTSSDAARTKYMSGWADFENSRGVTAYEKFKDAAAADPGFAMAYMMAAWTSPSTEGFVSNVGKASANLNGTEKGEQLLVEMLERFLANDVARGNSCGEKIDESLSGLPTSLAFPRSYLCEYQ